VRGKTTTRGWLEEGREGITPSGWTFMKTFCTNINYLELKTLFEREGFINGLFKVSAILEKCFIYNSRILSLFQQFGPDRSAELLRFSLSEERRGSFLANSSQLPFHSSFPYHLPIPQFFLNNPG